MVLCDKAEKEEFMKLVLLAMAFLAATTLTGCTGDKDSGTDSGTTHQTDSGEDSGL